VDPATQILTWRETIKELGVEAVHQHKLFDANTIQSHLTHKKPNGELTFEVRTPTPVSSKRRTPKLLPLDPKRPRS